MSHWTDRALCAGLNDDTFFPEKSEIGQAKRAKRICAQCSVIDECRAWAKETNQHWGIWGGTSTYERRKPRAYLGGGLG